jgi:hypothetical protein
MAYFRNLRAHFQKEHPEYSVSASIYYGYMDMTYFALFSESLKRRKLKIPIVFVHDTFSFEVWLSGSTRNVQSAYWRRIKESGWHQYELASTPERQDYVLAHRLVGDPDFGDVDALTRQIERGTLGFIRDVEGFLSHLED